MAIAVISGTGLYDMAIWRDSQELLVQTPYGAAKLYAAAFQGQELFFLPRHGLQHGVPPHLINYRANICALAQAGVRDILAFCSVGSMKKDTPPGSLLLLRQFIDMTWGRESSFSTIGAMGHVAMDQPYCPRLNDILLHAAAQKDIPLRDDGLYLCTQGPRFETPAEIALYASWGANLVGMTGVPEVVLAREAGLCYAAVGVVANYAAGLTASVDEAEVIAATRAQQKDVEALLLAFLEAETTVKGRDCLCEAAKIPPVLAWQ